MAAQNQKGPYIVLTEPSTMQATTQDELLFFTARKHPTFEQAQYDAMTHLPAMIVKCGALTKQDAARMRGGTLPYVVIAHHYGKYKIDWVWDKDDTDSYDVRRCADESALEQAITDARSGFFTQETLVGIELLILPQSDRGDKS